jgi:hypothetical protein
MINIKARDIAPLKKKIDSLSRKFVKIAYDEAALYLIGDQNRGLQYYPPYAGKSIKRRTYDLRFGWSVEFGMAGKTKIVNRMPYSKYVYTRWAGAPWKWKTIQQIVKKETPGMMRAIKEQIAKEITHEGFSKLF